MEHGFVNMSLWRDNRCVETFHLAPSAAAELVSFLVNGLTDAASVAPLAHVHTLTGTQSKPSIADRAHAILVSTSERVRSRAARALDHAASAVRP